MRSPWKPLGSNTGNSAAPHRVPWSWRGHKMTKGLVYDMLSQDGDCRHIAGTREYGNPKGKKSMGEQEKLTIWKTTNTNREGDNKLQNEEDYKDDGSDCSKFKSSKNVLWI